MAEAIYGFIKKESALDEKDAIYDKVLKAGEGWMHEASSRPVIQNS